MKIYDISQEVFSCKVFPGDPEPKKNTVCSIDGGAVCNLAQFAQLTEMLHKLPVFPPPGVGAAVEGVFVAFHAGFIAVVKAGAAGQGVLQEGCHQ